MCVRVRGSQLLVHGAVLEFFLLVLERKPRAVLKTLGGLQSQSCLLFYFYNDCMKLLDSQHQKSIHGLWCYF